MFAPSRHILAFAGLLATLHNAEAGSSALIQATDAAFLRLKASNQVRNLLRYTGLDTPSLAAEGPNMDVWTYYLEESGAEEEYPYPERSTLASNTLLSRVLETGVVHVCEFTPDYLAFPDEHLPVVETFASQLQMIIWETIAEHYSEEIAINWVYSEPWLGSAGHFSNLKRGRDGGGCDIDAAPAALGGYFEGLPRTTGPKGLFTASVPTMAIQFSIVVADDSSYTTFDDVLADTNNLSVCFANRNMGITETFFRDSVMVPVFPEIIATCESLVQSDETRTTIFFSEFESTDTTEKKEGFRILSTGIVTPIGVYSTNDEMPPMAGACVSPLSSALDGWCKDNCMVPGSSSLHPACDPTAATPKELICSCDTAGTMGFGGSPEGVHEILTDSPKSVAGPAAHFLRGNRAR
jgi:hypothetical protein